MTKALLHWVLLATSLAMLMFIGGFALAKLGLDWLTGLLFTVANKLLLSSFLALALLGLIGLLNTLVRQLREFFSLDARAFRQLLSIDIRQQDTDLQLHEQQRQLGYFYQLRRQRLAARNERKHLRALFDSINRELKAQKASTPAATYKQLQKALQQSLKRADSQAMLSIHQQLSCR